MKVCLITTGQPSTNPRLVKEADALADAGYDVHVLAAHWADWATDMDAELLASRPWPLRFIDWRRSQAPLLFHKSRARHWAARKVAAVPALAGRVAVAALSRVGPELQRAAMSLPADLYIAHNLGALPAACAAAAARSAKVGFDAEDFHSGQLSEPADGRRAAFTRGVEQCLLPCCAYVTAASPGIAEAYRELCGIEQPTCILNVFPLRDRPPRFRPTEAREPVRLYWFSQTIGPDRGLEDAVQAMGKLSAYDIELHLRGLWQTGYATHLRQVAVASGVAPERIVSHALANPDDMVRLSSAYDIGLAVEPCVSSNNDILLSNKLFTYLLAGNAVIATRTAGQSRMLPELGRAVSACEPGQPDSLAAAIRAWLERREALITARETAWSLGQTRFNWDQEKGRFLDVVAAALKRRTQLRPLHSPARRVFSRI